MKDSILPGMENLKRWLRLAGLIVGVLTVALGFVIDASGGATF